MVAKYDPSGVAHPKPGGLDVAGLKGSDFTILVVDDSADERFFLVRAFAKAGVRNPIQLVSSGAEALQYLGGDGKYKERSLYPLPRMVFLDLKMPPPDGLAVLAWKDKQPEMARILWVAISNASTVAAVNAAYTAGASTFLTKPVTAEDIHNLIGAFEEYRDKVGGRLDPPRR